MTTKRLSVVEYIPFERFVTEASNLVGVDPEEIRRAVARQGDRIRKLLGVSGPPIRLENDAFISEDVAGLIHLLPNLEVEIAPKFLGLSWPGWREDFLVVANLARSGQLLIREGISSSSGIRDDLTSLVARTYVDLFERSRRRPLRTYRPRISHDWSLDGDVDAEDIFIPSEEGYRLHNLALSSTNQFNAQIAGAATLIAPGVRDGVLQRQVRRIAQRLGPQAPASAYPKPRVPSRHRTWQQCYELANQINAGFGVRLSPGKLTAPGYVLTTWRAFEQLLVAAMRIGSDDSQVTYHPQFKLGEHSDGSPVIVEPDLMIRRPNGSMSILDAKYKGRADMSSRIAPSDLYEALAFAEATRLSKITLLYPRPAEGTDIHPIGSVEVFDEIHAAGCIIVGAVIESRGLSARGGFVAFARGLAALA